VSVIQPSFGKTAVAACIGAFGLLGVTRDAGATLGKDVASVQANEQHLNGARQVRALATGERHDIQLPSGTIVREYVSPAGVVYAVAWRGPRTPNLQELLGDYFPNLANRDRRGGHHNLTVTMPDFVVRATSHTNFSSGKAWVPSLVPSGVDVAALD
jgi:hypothetical protein